MPTDRKIVAGHTYRMPFGNISIFATDKGICRIELASSESAMDFAANDATNKCAEELIEYLAGKRAVFDIPTDVTGTDFQLKVWNAVSEIPYSQTRTVREVADSIGESDSFRAVGRSIRQNPLPIIIPAHRVVTSNANANAADKSSRLRAAFRDLEKKNSLS